MRIYCRMWRTVGSHRQGVFPRQRNVLSLLPSTLWAVLSDRDFNWVTSPLMLFWFSTRLGWKADQIMVGNTVSQSSKLWFSTKSLRPRPPVRSRLPPEPVRRSPQVRRKTPVYNFYKQFNFLYRSSFHSEERATIYLWTHNSSQFHHGSPSG